MRAQWGRAGRLAGIRRGLQFKRDILFVRAKPARFFVCNAAARNGTAVFVGAGLIAWGDLGGSAAVAIGGRGFIIAGAGGIQGGREADMNLLDLFAIGRQSEPGKKAIEFVDSRGPLGSRDLTFAALQAEAQRWAAAFTRMGVSKGDRVALYLCNRPEFVIAYLAALEAGAVMVPINLRYRRRELSHILNDAEPALLVMEDVQQAVVDEIMGADVGPGLNVLSVDKTENWLEEADREAQGREPSVPATGDDAALIMYTSGTTGTSKGAVLTHNHVLATVTGLLSAWAWQADDVLLLPLPLFHTHGLVVGLHCALAMGATVRLRTAFDADETVETLSTGGATLFFAVPTIYTRLVDLLGKAKKPPKFAGMRLFCSGSAPLPAEVHNEFERLTGHRILERYGMTETGMNFSNPYAGPRVAGTVGTPLPGVFARIVDAAGKDLPAGEEGELLLRGSNVFDEYWRAPQKTSESFVHDELGIRWFQTGDLARMDPLTGYVTLLGRSHELIISGGLNIYPREVEEMLTTFPGIEEAAVVGEPDAEWGEAPVAYLVCSGELDEADLERYCRGQLASYKLPRRLRIVRELPRNAMGKVQKHLLPRGGV